MKNKFTWILIAAYVFSRWFIWEYRPTEFTEILYSYMPYAHLWASGEEPYLEHWFEYPPATALWFYIPHLYDMATLHQPWHLPYLPAYRLMMLIIDIALFSLIWKTMIVLKANQAVIVGGLSYYILTTAKAHHFIYDSMDLVFALAITISAVGTVLWKHSEGIFITWIGYFLGLSLKLANAPLALVYFLAQSKQWKKALLLSAIAFILVWGYPLAHYRSSLQVMLVYHQIRGLQIESVPATISRVIHQFTQSEEIFEAYKNYEIRGPVSTTIKRIFDPLFVLSVVGLTIWLSWLIIKAPVKRRPIWALWGTQALILLLMVTAKVASTPFLLWHIPILALFPYSNLKQQFIFTIPSLLIVILSMTPIPDLAVGPLSTHVLIAFYRSLAFFGLFIAWIKLRKVLAL
jgi:hypothetical protein